MGLAFPPFISKEEAKTKTNSITNANNSTRSGADSSELFHEDFLDEYSLSSGEE